MSSIIERLTEGVVNRDVRAESHALLSKWQKTGLLEGLDSERQQNAMARLLENQAKELLRESTTMASGDIEGFAAVAFPIVRRVFAGLIANDLVSVQPMSLPSGLIFFLDFTFSGDIGETTQAGRFGNTAGSSIYGTDRVGSQITGGVNLVGANGQDLSGPRTSARGYAYASPTASLTVDVSDAAKIKVWQKIDFSDGLTQTERSYFQYDPDLSALASSSVAAAIYSLPESALSNADLDNFSSFAATAAELDKMTGIGASAALVRRLTRPDPDTAGNYLLTVIGASGSAGVDPGVVPAVAAAAGGTDWTLVYPQRDAFQSGANTDLGAVRGNTPWGLEGNADIPEIDIKVDSIAVTAQTKKLKAKWTPELGQDLNAYHNLDAEVELTSLLSEQIALEIDREILADLVNGATAGTRYWSRAPGLFLDSNGNEIGANTKAPDFTGTVSEWYETLVETINDVSAQIHRKTLRGGANFVVLGPEMANILEFTAGFRASVTHTDERGDIGALKVGSLSKKFDVIVDPYFLRNVILVGRRGSSFLESGYVYAPYVPLQTTPTIFGPEDFVPRKGVMTRYAKKMVRPDMYGLVIVRGLLGESGS
jgi:hypothetical protein